MLRPFGETLEDLAGGLVAMAAAASSPVTAFHLTGMELTLPVDLRMVLADGGCRLLGDVPRNRSEGALAAPSSQLKVRFVAQPVDGCAP
jgi:hypothetical protein